MKKHNCWVLFAGTVPILVLSLLIQSYRQENEISKLNDKIIRIYQILLEKDSQLAVFQQKIESQQKQDLESISTLSTQVNQNKNIIDQLSTKMDVLPFLSTTVEYFEKEVPAIKDSLSSLNLKINSDTFNKIELFGPFYPHQHSIRITSTNSGTYYRFQTLQPCILIVKGKAIITLIATGHAMTNGPGEGQASFMMDGKVNLHFTADQDWQFGAQYIYHEWNPINLTQEFQVEEGTYEFALGITYVGGSSSLYLNAVSFIAKVTYIS